uniref:coiled-coil domain-containing protein 42-like n=1 Tax=Centroberyx gerrardi TaxID=166262 RepID=UPI003AAFFEEB
MAGNVSSDFTNCRVETLLNQLKEDTSAGNQTLSHYFHHQQKRQEARRANDAMSMQIEEHISTLKTLKMRKVELREEAKRRDHLQNVDNQLKEKEAKLHQVLNKVEQERQQTEQKEAKICDLQEEVKAMIKTRERLEKQIQKATTGLSGLQELVQTSEEFQDIGEVKSRFDTLTSNRERLLRVNQQSLESIGNINAQIARHVQHCNDVLLSRNNALTELQSQMDRCRAKKLILESTWSGIQNTTADATLELGRIKMSVLSLYQSLYNNYRGAEDEPIAASATLEQLDMIPVYISSLMSMGDNLCKEDPE